MSDSWVSWIVFAVILSCILLIVGFFAQPVADEVKSVWTPDSYRYENIIGQENVQVYDAQFGGHVLYISSEEFQRSFKNSCTIITSSGSFEQSIYYLAENAGITYVATNHYEGSILVVPDRSVLLDNGQLHLSYRTNWPFVMLAVIFGTVLSIVVALLISSKVEDVIGSIQYWWKYERQRAPTG
jgi:hypothetical protein